MLRVMGVKVARDGDGGRNGTIDAASRSVFIRFGVASLVGTAIDFSLLWLLVSVVGLGVLPAKLLASEGAILNSFVWNERWTFAGRSSPHGLPRRLASFHGAYLGSLVLSLVVVGVGVSLWGPHAYLLANALALPANFLWTYALSNWVIWRRSATVQADGEGR